MANSLRASMLCLGSLSLLLSGCSFGDDDADDGSVVTSEYRQAALAKAGVAELQPGLWEYTLEVDSVRLPAMARKREADIIEQIRSNAARSQCVSQDEAQTVPTGLFAPNGRDCSYSKFEFAGRQMQIALSCAMESMGAVDMELAGEIQAAGFDMDADISVRLPMIGKVTAQGKYIGKRTGDCD